MTDANERAGENPDGSEWEPVRIEARTPNTAATLLHHRHNHEPPAACTACEILTLRAALVAERSEVQRYMPAGAVPPVGDAVTVIRWIIQSALAAEREKGRAEEPRIVCQCDDGGGVNFNCSCRIIGERRGREKALEEVASLACKIGQAYVNTGTKYGGRVCNQVAHAIRTELRRPASGGEK